MILSLMFFDMAFWFYLAASVFYIGYWVIKREWIGSTGTVLVIVAFVANTMSMVYRTIETDHMPWANLYESMTLFIFITTIAYLYLEFRHKMKVIGAFIVPIIFIATFAAASLQFKYQNPQPLNPALQSIWFKLHVFSAFIGYAGFGLAFGLGLIYLLKNKFEELRKPNVLIDRLPKANLLDELSYKSIAWGFIFFTMGALVLGAVWANKAWGSYWSWDPKETWSLITWFIYAAYLHARVTRGWRGKKAAYIAIAGFLSTIFLYWGVSFVLPGLHAYG